MRKTKPQQRIAILIGALALLFASAAGAGNKRFADIVVFGDSLSDPGNAFVLTGQTSRAPFDLIPSAPYARGGLHFSNGRTWAERFATALGRRSGAALRAPGVFSNYAIGGARAGAAGATDLGAQVNLYLASHGGAKPDALHVIFIGGNDIRDALAALASDPSGATSGVLLSRAVTAIADNLVALAGAGATRFLVFNAPDLSLVPAVRLQGPLAQGAALFLSAQFNQALDLALDSVSALVPVADITRFDLFTLFNTVVAAPALFGFSEVEQTCITPGVIVKAVCKHPKRYLFWDGIHPTRAGHRLIAERAEALFVD